MGSYYSSQRTGVRGARTQMTNMSQPIGMETQNSFIVRHIDTIQLLQDNTMTYKWINTIPVMNLMQMMVIMNVNVVPSVVAQKVYQVDHQVME
jgi:hypothetical protein